MKNTRISVVVSLFCMVFASCEDKSSKSEEVKTDSVAATTPAPVVREKMDEHVIEQIVAYYKKNYEHDSDAMETTDSTIELVLSGKIDQSDKDEHFLLVAYIPKDAKNVMKGDMDGDNIPEMIVDIGTEGGGGGGNVWGNDIFVFALKNGKYELLTAKASPSVCGCDEHNGGFYYPNSLENGKLKGESLCYGDDDGRCCPSIHYDTYLKLEKGELKFDSHKRLADIKQQ